MSVGQMVIEHNDNAEKTNRLGQLLYRSSVSLFMLLFLIALFLTCVARALVGFRENNQICIYSFKRPKKPFNLQWIEDNNSA